MSDEMIKAKLIPIPDYPVTVQCLPGQPLTSEKIQAFRKFVALLRCLHDPDCDHREVKALEGASYRDCMDAFGWTDDACGASPNECYVADERIREAAEWWSWEVDK